MRALVCSECPWRGLGEAVSLPGPLRVCGEAQYCSSLSASTRSDRVANGRILTRQVSPRISIHALLPLDLGLASYKHIGGGILATEEVWISPMQVYCLMSKLSGGVKMGSQKQEAGCCRQLR